MRTSTTIERRHSLTAATADLLRDRPDHDTPPAERVAWLARKVELLVAMQAAKAGR